MSDMNTVRSHLFTAAKRNHESRPDQQAEWVEWVFSTIRAEAVAAERARLVAILTKERVSSNHWRYLAALDWAIQQITEGKP